MATVTALRHERRERIRVELDGAPWRTLPAAAVIDAGLLPGAELDRTRARALNRALRRAAALERAAALLGHADRSPAGLDAALARRGHAASERRHALATLARLGYLDERRFAVARADTLARRGLGDEAIRFELERQGVERERIEAALAGLAPELERARGLADGLPTTKAARTLAAKGFAAETIESLLGVEDG